MKQKTISIFIILMTLIGFSSTTFASEYLSQKDIESSARGYLLKGTGFKEVRVVSVRASKSKKSECLVHTPSIIKELKRRIKPGETHSAPILFEVNLQPKVHLGGIICAGIGSGCTVLVAVMV